MSARRAGGPATAVLRGVELHAQPHTLLRPSRGNGMAVKAVHALQTQASPPPVPQAISAGTANQEAVIAHARAEGFAAGQEAAQQALQQTLASLEAQAREQGRLAGLERAIEEADQKIKLACANAQEQAQAQIRAKLARIDELAEGLAAQIKSHLVEFEDDLVALSYDAVCRILGREAVRPESLQAMVRQLTSQRSDAGDLSVHVHPDDLAALRSSGTGSLWNWVADETVRMGGVVLRSSQGSLDARLETQMAALRDALIAQRRQSRAKG